METSTETQDKIKWKAYAPWVPVERLVRRFILIVPSVKDKYLMPLSPPSLSSPAYIFPILLHYRKSDSACIQNSTSFWGALRYCCNLS